MGVKCTGMKSSEASSGGRKSLDANCHKHLFLDDAIASGLQLNVARVLLCYEMDQTPHLDAGHGGQVQTCYKVKSHPFKSLHESST